MGRRAGRAAALIECLTLAAAGVVSLGWWEPTVRYDRTSASLIAVLAAVEFALAAAFGAGAYLLGRQRVERRRFGVALVVGATVFSTLVAAFLGIWETSVIPNTAGYWPPWIAFATAVVLVGLGFESIFDRAAVTVAAPRGSPLLWAVVAGSCLESLAFGGVAVYLLWLGVASSFSGYGGFANFLNFLAAALLLMLAAGFGIGALLIGNRWFETRITGARMLGAVPHLAATILAAAGAIWVGVYQTDVDQSYGYWPPWIAFAIAGVVIAIGMAVIASLLTPARQQPAR